MIPQESEICSLQCCGQGLAWSSRAVIENRCSFLEGNLVLAKIGACLSPIPNDLWSRRRFFHVYLHAHRKRLGARLVGIGSAAPALEPSLQQAHQAGVPVA